MNRTENDLKPYERVQKEQAEGGYQVYWATVTAVCILLFYVTVQGFLLLWVISPVAALTTLVALLGASLIALSIVQR